LPSKLGAVVQDYKPNYLEGGRDWEDGGWKLTCAKSMTAYL
jgi:hypothetical protein